MQHVIATVASPPLTLARGAAEAGRRAEKHILARARLFPDGRRAIPTLDQRVERDKAGGDKGDNGRSTQNEEMRTAKGGKGKRGRTGCPGETGEK